MKFHNYFFHFADISFSSQFPMEFTAYGFAQYITVRNYLNKKGLMTMHKYDGIRFEDTDADGRAYAGNAYMGIQTRRDKTDIVTLCLSGAPGTYETMLPGFRDLVTKFPPCSVLS